MLVLIKKQLLVIVFLSFAVNVVAEDIDLFTGVAPPVAGDEPNVLIVLDNTANWNTAFVNEIAALIAVFNGLETDKFRVGLMMFSETGAGNGNPAGGYVRSAVRLMDTTNKTLYQDLFNSLDKNADKSNNGKLGITMAEAYYYFSGENAYAGHNKEKRDYTGNSSGTAADNAVYALAGNAFDSASEDEYESPVNSGCQKNFIIYISNGAVQDNSSDTFTANSLLTDAGGDATQISLSPSGSQSGAGDEWARFMATDSSTKINTYTIDVDPVLTGQGPGFSELLKSMATQGKGKYFAVDSSVNNGEEISIALNKIFSEIQAVDSVFASVSLPVSINAQGTFLNQIYVGMFRPDAAAAPRWNGNLKQYQFKASLSGDKLVLKLADADSVEAINKNTGFITQCARSFWTPDTANLDTYWSFNPQGSCTTIVDSKNSNTPDGDIVEKGGGGYRLRAITPSSRYVKTCDPSGCANLLSFDTANASITQALLNVSNSTERTDLINWIRGMDVQDENGNSDTSEMRPSAHGDVIHSRPVTIDYGGSTGVVVFYGSGDGMLHAINGNQSSSIGTHPAGDELWSFVAPEHYGKFKRIYDNSPAITLPSQNDSTVKPYFFDGGVTTYTDNGTVWIYASQRRGGRMLYAFDVTTPTNPSFKWRQGCPNLVDDAGCTAGFSSIGQTWSAAKSLKSSGYSLGTQPMLIMGGGYDTCEDGVGADDQHTCGATPKGNGVFVLDADSGALLNTFTTERSVIADVTVVPNQQTGLAEYAYAVDTGGNIYRIAIGSNAPASWSMTKIASLGCDTAICPAGTIVNRKFMFAPEVVITPDYNIILVGSGDREHPLLSNTLTTSVNNAFFMIKDNPADTGWWTSEAANCEALPLACKASLLEVDPASTAIPTEAELAAKKGWYLQFGSGNHDKEQVVTSAIAVLGVVTFSTHRPTAPDVSSCGSNLGEARVYNIGFVDSRPAKTERFSIVTGGGLPPSPVSGMVTVNVPSKGQVTLPFVIGMSSDSSLEAESPIPIVTPASYKTRAYWYLQQ